MYCVWYVHTEYVNYKNNYILYRRRSYLIKILQNPISILPEEDIIIRNQ